MVIIRNTIFYMKKSASCALGVFMCFAWCPPPKSRYACTIVFSTFFCSCPPYELDLSVCVCVCPPFPPPPSYTLLLTEGSYFIARLLIYILDYIYIMFVYNIVLFLKMLFRCNALYTYTSENILWITCTVFSASLRPDIHLQGFGRRVALWSVIRVDHFSSQHQRRLLTYNNNISQPTLKKWFYQTVCGKSSKMQLCLLCCGNAGEKGTLIQF